MIAFKSAFTGLLFLVGALLSLHSAWLPVKGWLSQQLISYSWSYSKVSGDAPKPWPWADTKPAFSLSVPKLSEQVVVLTGTDATTLAFSAGVLQPFSSIDQANTIVVAGHKDSHFAFVQHIKKDDVLVLTNSQNQQVKFNVSAIKSYDTLDESFHYDSHKKQLLLVTCFPFESSFSQSSQRYVVVADVVTDAVDSFEYTKSIF